ncbi:MAG: CBM9, partial [uncultured Gemmatimonadaceae bacterium]
AGRDRPRDRAAPHDARRAHAAPARGGRAARRGRVGARGHRERLRAAAPAHRDAGALPHRGARALRRRPPVRGRAQLRLHPRARDHRGARARLRLGQQRRVRRGARHLPRPAQLVPLHHQPQGGGARRADVQRLAHDRRRVGGGGHRAHGGGAHRGRRLRVDGGDGRAAAHPALRRQPPGAGVGGQLPAPRAARERVVVLGAARAAVPPAPHVQGGHAHRARRAAPGAQPAGQALRRGVGVHGRAGAGRGARRRRRRGARPQVRPHAVAHARRHLQHRLLAGRGGPGAGEPHALLALLPRAARVLHRERRRLHLRRRRGARLPHGGVAARLHPVQLAPHRHHARRPPDADRRRGPRLGARRRVGGGAARHAHARRPRAAGRAVRRGARAPQPARQLRRGRARLEPVGRQHVQPELRRGREPAPHRQPRRQRLRRRERRRRQRVRRLRRARLGGLPRPALEQLRDVQAGLRRVRPRAGLRAAPRDAPVVRHHRRARPPAPRRDPGAQPLRRGGLHHRPRHPARDALRGRGAQRLPAARRRALADGARRVRPARRAVRRLPRPRDPARRLRLARRHGALPVGAGARAVGERERHRRRLLRRHAPLGRRVGRVARALRPERRGRRAAQRRGARRRELRRRPREPPAALRAVDAPVRQRVPAVQHADAGRGGQRAREPALRPAQRRVPRLHRAARRPQRRAQRAHGRAQGDADGRVL